MRKLEPVLELIVPARACADKPYICGDLAGNWELLGASALRDYFAPALNDLIFRYSLRVFWPKAS